MDKRSTRAFATGLLLSAVLLMGYQHFYGSNTVKKGYKYIKTSELSKLQNDVDIWKQRYNELQKQNTNSIQKPGKTEQTIVKYHLSITSGMTPDIIGKRLKTGGIIKDNKKFVQYLISHKYHNKIQIGEYELTSKMKFEKIANIITKGK